ncbi:hypothetical protein SORBI_3004G301500 [Sorghum bicolor]|uniref:Uncharacterized protein n=1 Tax=Sorghum bicolor TaxID=4558 RepID=A0A1Z5RPU7_SORBI|nr:hypothetical protein SORBI_3004G301500 [Sorghum bicolor]
MFYAFADKLKSVSSSRSLSMPPNRPVQNFIYRAPRTKTKRVASTLPSPSLFAPPPPFPITSIAPCTSLGASVPLSMAPNLSSDAPKFPTNPKHGKADVEAAAAVVHGSPAGCVVNDYLARAQWLRAAVLGANDGLVSVASLMIGVGAVHDGAREMLVSGLAGLVAGACSMAVGEFVSVYAQYDIQVAHSERGSSDDDSSSSSSEVGRGGGGDEERLPSPTKAAAASALAFAVGAALPLLSGAFVRPWAIRVAAVSLGLAGFGAAGAYLGGASIVRSGVRVLLGGWLAMAVTFGILRLLSLAFKTHVASA